MSDFKVCRNGLGPLNGKIRFYILNFHVTKRLRERINFLKYRYHCLYEIRSELCGMLYQCLTMVFILETSKDWNHRRHFNKLDLRLWIRNTTNITANVWETVTVCRRISTHWVPSNYSGIKIRSRISVKGFLLLHESLNANDVINIW